MFTLNHFIWLGICAAFIGALMFISKKLKFNLRQALITVLAISFISEACKIFTHIEEFTDDYGNRGGVLGANYLPLHLCSTLIFLFISFTSLTVSSTTSGCA